MTNTLAYYDMAAITTVKSFIVQAPCAFKTFQIRNVRKIDKFWCFSPVNFYKPQNTMFNKS